ncbi:hypothetical protein [Chthonobacter rhizosphaerae]|nr:hypothetical protein [Chthonobacter rhizosphaerae]
MTIDGMMFVPGSARGQDVVWIRTVERGGKQAVPVDQALIRRLRNQVLQ